MDSYNEILDRMTSKYKQLTNADLSDESDIMMRMKTLSGEIYNMGVMADFIKRQMFVSTASGEYLDMHALQRGLSRKTATKSTGRVTFSTSLPAVTDIVINKGTIVSTASPNAMRFETDETVVIPTGSSEVTVNATATKEGADHNVLVNTITVLVTPPMGVTSVTNRSYFDNGTDTESDEKLRQRLLDSYKYISNGTNAVSYKRLAESVSGIYSAGVIPRVRGDGTVNVYVNSKGDDAPQNAINEVRRLIAENRELNVDISVENATDIDISLTMVLNVEDGYSFTDVSNEIREKLHEYINSLGIGNAMLLKDLGDIVYHTNGVKNYEFLPAFCSDCFPAQSQYCVCEHINFRTVR